MARSAPVPAELSAPVPTHDLAAEDALIGSILDDATRLDDVLWTVAPADLYQVRHRLIYEAIITCAAESGGAYDSVTVNTRLRSTGRMEAVGGEHVLAGLLLKVPTGAHAAHYAKIVADKAVLRRLTQAATAIARLAVSSNGSPVVETVAAAEATLRNLTITADAPPVSMSESLSTYLDKIEERRAHQGAVVGIPTGYLDLDRLTGGIVPSNLVLVAGRPGTGKTSFMLQAARHAAGKGHPTAVFSLEMSRDELNERLVAAESRVSTDKLRSGRLSQDEYGRVADALGRLADLPLYLDDRASLTVAGLHSKVRRLIGRHGIEMVVVDYLQLLHWHNKTKDRVAEVSEISRGLKEMAGEFGVALLAGSQLNRLSEARQDKRPQLADLRESGTLEQDANVVVLLHRDDLHNPKSTRKDIADVLVAKNRSGATGDFQMRWFGAWTLFADLTERAS